MILSATNQLVATLNAYSKDYLGTVMSPLLPKIDQVCIDVVYVIGKGGELRIYITNQENSYTGIPIWRTKNHIGDHVTLCPDIPDSWEYVALVLEAYFAEEDADSIIIRNVQIWERYGSESISYDGEYISLFMHFLLFPLQYLFRMITNEINM